MRKANFKIREIAFRDGFYYMGLISTWRETRQVKPHLSPLADFVTYRKDFAKIMDSMIASLFMATPMKPLLEKMESGFAHDHEPAVRVSFGYALCLGDCVVFLEEGLEHTFQVSPEKLASRFF